MITGTELNYNLGKVMFKEEEETGIDVNLFRPSPKAIRAKRDEIRLHVLYELESCSNVEDRINTLLNEWVEQSTRDAMNFQLN